MKEKETENLMTDIKLLSRKKNWHRVTGKWIYEQWGLSPRTVFFRWIQTCFITTFIVAVIHCIFIFVFDKLGNGVKIWYDSTLLVGFIGAYWAIYSAFSQEFVEKYRRLADLQYALPKPRFLVRREKEEKFPMYFFTHEVLNFGESCVLYNMQEHPQFKFSFCELTERLKKIQEEFPREYCFLMMKYPTLANQLAKKGENEKESSLKNFEEREKILNVWESKMERRKNPRSAGQFSEIRVHLEQVQLAYPKTGNQIKLVLKKVRELEDAA